MRTTRRSRAKQALRYCLRIELAEVKPTIWRRVWVEGQMSLLQLHHIIQAAMGWTDAHLHQFTIGDRHYGTPDPDDAPEHPVIDERTIRLDQVLAADLHFEYLYDFGDGWTHLIQVEQTKSMDEPYGAAHVEVGARACPPEDSGGPYGYQEFLDRLAANPRHKEVVTFLEWAGKDFDAARFDRLAANAALLRMAWNRWGEK